MSEETGGATSSMRLRPAAGSRPATPSPADSPGARALEELLDLHGWTLVRLCRECLLPYPCQTRRLLEVVAGIPTPPEKGSQ